MTISRPRRREKKLRREGTEKKREQKKDWTKKKIKEITEVVQTMTEEEFDALPESLSETLKYLRKIDNGRGIENKWSLTSFHRKKN